MGGDSAVISDNARVASEASAAEDKCRADAFGKARGDSAEMQKKSDKSPCSSGGGGCSGGKCGQGEFQKAVQNMPLIGGLLRLLGMGR